MKRTWTIERHPATGSFRESIEHLLLRNEAENTLLLGLMGSLDDGTGHVRAPAYLAVAIRNGEAVGAALAPRDYPICISRMPAAGGAAIARDLARSEAFVPGAVGPGLGVRGFVRTWTTKRAYVVRDERRYRLHMCGTAVSVPSAPGRIRSAGPADRDRIAMWLRTFGHEAGTAAIDSDALAERLIGGQSAFLWDDDGPVSLAVATAATRNGIRIGYVYTPRAYRSKGYATACVATLTRRALASGRKFCCLYTDAQDGRADRIYTRIGYRVVGAATDYRFAARRSDTARRDDEE